MNPLTNTESVYKFIDTEPNLLSVDNETFDTMEKILVNASMDNTTSQEERDKIKTYYNKILDIRIEKQRKGL